MQILHRRALVFALKIFDQFILVCAFLLAAAAVSESIDSLRFYDFLFLRINAINFVLYLIFALVWYGIFLAQGLYHARRFQTWQSELKDVVNATLLGTFILLGVSILFSITLANPLFLFLFWFYTTVATLTSRLL